MIMEPAGLTERPLRPIVSSASYDMIQQTGQARAEERRAWEHPSRQAPGPPCTR
ncbi:hypothetical protein [Nonomuraea sp. NPDC049400]|uniref:hypothetical protein n=1 Tax=Nonomuraea sp. NPDC049400 TaxID=3364352 RepID=UPI0037B022BA